MQIQAIEAFQVSLPLRRPTRLPWGTLDALDTVVVRLESEGLSGWGEATPGRAPVSSAEWAGGALRCVSDWLAPALLNQRVESGDDLQKLLGEFHGNRYAKAALDLAWWDLEARRQGKPLHQLLGGTQPAVDIGPTFDQMESIEDLLAALKQAFAAGYARVGLKFRPGWDIQMINFVRHEFPVEAIHIDCEAALGLEHMEMLCRLDDFSLAMIEQPLPADDLVGHAMVQETVRTALCLDEAVGTVEQAQMALELHSCKWVKIEPGRVGGLTPAMAIHNACQEGNTPCWVGPGPQSSIGLRASAALASKANFTYPMEYAAPGELLAADLAEAPTVARDTTDGQLKIVFDQTAGLGVDPDRGAIEKHAVARWHS